MRPTVLRISERALYDNARAIRGAIPANVGMVCVVKADAYGHGAIEAAHTMLAARADAFAVAIVEEAEALRAAGIAQPVLILGGGNEDSLRRAVRADVSQAVYEADMLDVLQDEAVRCGRAAKAHLKIDTGMGRIGVRDMDALGALLTHWRESCPQVRMTGIFTHFCAADSDAAFTEMQNARFAAALDAVRAAGFSPVAHAAATTAMMDPRYQYDYVRAGIGLYGTLLPELDGKLKYAQTLATRPVRIERIGMGESIGYSRSFYAPRDMRVMTVPIGYGDGYPRALSNRAPALVCGRRARVVGNVCMDMLMLDVTDIPQADMNSEVVLMGAQGAERITPDELAEIAGTIPYEIMLGFSQRVPRVYERMN